jgi:signal peptidase I
MSKSQQIITKTVVQDVAESITQSSLLSPHHLFVDVSVDLLRRGYSVRFQANGRSMHPTIQEGEWITVEPVEPSHIKRRDIILYQNHNGVIAHRVVKIGEKSNKLRGLRTEQKRKFSTQPSAISDQVPTTSETCVGDDLFLSPQSSSLITFFILRGDALAVCDQPVPPQQVLGKVVSVERDGQLIDLHSRKAKLFQTVRLYVHRFKRWIVQVSL